MAVWGISFERRRFSMRGNRLLTRRLRLLLILGLGVLMVAVLLARLDLPLFRGETTSGGAPPPGAAVVATPDAALPLDQRPLALPVLRPRDACPLNKGSKEAVPKEPYIFGAG